MRASSADASARATGSAVAAAIEWNENGTEHVGDLQVVRGSTVPRHPEDVEESL